MSDALRLALNEAWSYARRLRRTRAVSFDGIEVLVDYERWSPLLVRRVLAQRYEVEERKLVPQIVKEGDRVLEIGGGVGLVAMLCARTVGASNVFVYEANPQIVDAARANLRRNGVDAAIYHGAVVGRSCGVNSVSFHVSDDFWSSSVHPHPGTRRQITVPAFRLDDLITAHAPNVIIADVEGAEYELLLESDLSTITKLCVECHTRYIGASKVSELVRSLLVQGFTLELEKSIGEVLFFSRRRQ